MIRTMNKFSYGSQHQDVKFLGQRSFPLCQPLRTAVFASFWLGVELVRGLGPVVCSLGSGNIQTGDSGVQFSVVVVTAERMVIKESSQFFIFYLVQDGYSPFQLGHFLAQAEAAVTFGWRGEWRHNI